MRIVLATGGSGGHLFPALKVADVLKKRGHDVKFCGTFGTTVGIVNERGYEYFNLKARGLTYSNPVSFLLSVFFMIGACFESIVLLNKIKPEVICGFGGYGAFPVVLAGRIRGIPVMIHEQNAVPGRANVLLGKWVKKIALSFHGSEAYFQKNETVLTGCPCHQVKQELTQEYCKNQFGLNKLDPVILVLGGSQGSRRINEVVSELAVQSEKEIKVQWIHMTGRADYARVKDRYTELKMPSAVSAFIHNIEEAYQAADLVIARSGAATVSELALFKKLSILIPYPYAGGHQKENAKILADSFVATIINESHFNAAILKEKILEQLTRIKTEAVNDRAFSKAAFPDADQLLAEEITSLAS